MMLCVSLTPRLLWFVFVQEGEAVGGRPGPKPGGFSRFHTTFGGTAASPPPLAQEWRACYAVVRGVTGTLSREPYSCVLLCPDIYVPWFVYAFIIQRSVVFRDIRSI